MRLASHMHTRARAHARTCTQTRIAERVHSDMSFNCSCYANALMHTRLFSRNFVQLCLSSFMLDFKKALRILMGRVVRLTIWSNVWNVQVRLHLECSESWIMPPWFIRNPLCFFFVFTMAWYSLEQSLLLDASSSVRGQAYKTKHDAGHIDINQDKL